MAGKIREQLFQRNRLILTKHLKIEKFYLFTHIYQEVMGINLKFLKEKVKGALGNDRDVSTDSCIACIIISEFINK